MKEISWDQKFSVQVEAMDEQHRVLFSNLNELMQAIENQEGDRALSRILPELIRYTEDHFQSEEAMLERMGYPELERHKEEHRKYEQMVQDLKKTYEEENAPISLTVLEFIVNWLKNHILGTDMRYSRYLQQHNLHP